MKIIEEIIKILFSRTTYGAPGGFHIEGPLVFVLTILAVLVGIFAASLVWVYQDAEKRNKNGLIGLLFIVLTGWPASFIWWFWLRPPFKDRP